jgi:hypothetical protein
MSKFALVATGNVEDELIECPDDEEEDEER